jgi:hypothetical protein
MKSFKIKYSEKYENHVLKLHDDAHEHKFYLTDKEINQLNEILQNAKKEEYWFFGNDDYYYRCKLSDTEFEILKSKVKKHLES